MYILQAVNGCIGEWGLPCLVHDAGLQNYIAACGPGQYDTPVDSEQPRLRGDGDEVYRVRVDLPDTDREQRKPWPAPAAAGGQQRNPDRTKRPVRRAVPRILTTILEPGLLPYGLNGKALKRLHVEYSRRGTPLQRYALMLEQRRSFLLVMLVAYPLLNGLAQWLAASGIGDLLRALGAPRQTGQGLLAVVHTIIVVLATLLLLLRLNLKLPRMQHWAQRMDDESVLLAIDAAIQENPLADRPLLVENIMEKLGVRTEHPSFPQQVASVATRFDQAILSGSGSSWSGLAMDSTIAILALLHYNYIYWFSSMWPSLGNLLVAAIGVALPLYAILKYKYVIWPSLLMREMVVHNILDSYFAVERQ